MGVIFYFSSRTATQSSEQSGYFVELLQRLFGSNAVTDFIVRKSAHFLEFTGLALLFALALFVQLERTKTPLAVAGRVLVRTDCDRHSFHSQSLRGRGC